MSANLEQFLQAYIVAALWSSSGESAEYMDAEKGADDLAPETLAKMRADCVAFLAANSTLIECASGYGDYARDSIWSIWERAGHDFWLTRCGHGVGFWDRGLGVIGQRLTDAAAAFGNVDLYIGDNGMVYA